jgi:hypothetical protein
MCSEHYILVEIMSSTNTRCESGRIERVQKRYGAEALRELWVDGGALWRPGSRVQLEELSERGLSLGALAEGVMAPLGLEAIYQSTHDQKE